MAVNIDRFMPDERTIAAIEKDIENYNHRRRYAKGEVQRRLLAFFGPLAVAALVLLGLFIWRMDQLPPMTVHVLTIGFLAGGAALAIWGHRAAWRVGDDIQQEFRNHILPVLFGFLDEVHYWRGQEPSTFAYLPDVMKGGTYNRTYFDDVIFGRLEGKPFEIYELKLIYERKRSSSVRFEGLVLVCKAGEPMPGTLIATRRSQNGLVQSFDTFMRSVGEFLRRERLEPVESDTVLDEIYEFRTDRPEAAISLLSGRTGEVLKWVASTWRGGVPRLGVKRDTLFLMLPSKANFFELPPLETPLEYERDIDRMANEVAALLGIVDEIQRPPPQPEENLPPEAEPEPQQRPRARKPFVRLLDGGELSSTDD